MDPRAVGKVIGEKRFLGRVSRRVALSAIIILGIVAGGLIGWNIYLQQSKKIEPASMKRMAFPLPEKPSIVVLPFVNMSGDPEQEYFSDGTTEEIINGLSKIPNMFVIARHSSFSYKGKPVKVQQVAEELGVRYVMEGSVRVVGDRVRVTAQLIDAITGHHLWSERYDRVLNDIFAIQDDITVNIMQAMQMKVAGLGFLEDRPTTSLEAYLKLLKGIEHVYRFNKNDNALAKKLYGEAIALDPDYGPAYRLLGLTHYHDVMNAWTEYPGKSLEKAEQLAQKGLALGDDMSYFLLSNIYLQKGQFDKAIIAGEKGLAFNANNANYIAMFSIPLTSVGRHQEAIAMIKKAIRLNPYHPPWVLSVLGGVYTGAGRYEEAIEVLKKHNQRFPNFIKSHMDLTASYGLLGREQEARESAKEVLRLDPEFSIEKYAISINMLFENEEDKKQYIDALRKAGLK
jgi:adenylate cyclase